MNQLATEAKRNIDKPEVSAMCCGLLSPALGEVIWGHKFQPTPALAPSLENLGKRSLMITLLLCQQYTQTGPAWTTYIKYIQYMQYITLFIMHYVT